MFLGVLEPRFIVSTWIYFIYDQVWFLTLIELFYDVITSEMNCNRVIISLEKSLAFSTFNTQQNELKN